jgi:hypothetical protein
MKTQKQQSICNSSVKKKLVFKESNIDCFGFGAVCGGSPKVTSIQHKYVCGMSVR